MPDKNGVKEIWMQQLEDLFQAFSLIATDSYVFLSDMEHDYSIWSRNAVDTFDLPGTHMINAGEKWEKNIHPDDRDAYHKSIEKIFSGEMNAHDMQYRARERSGRYDMCTCRGIVVRDENGKPKYFGGSIKNNSLENKIDNLTGLMNRAGFFEALKEHIKNHVEATIVMFGPSQFSRVNSLYGYEVGNKTIYQMARHFASELANYGDFFRLDGTQSILISHSISIEKLKEKYEKLSQWMQDGIEVDEYKVPLRLNGAFLKLDQFNVDDNTIFVCLNTAFQKSKREENGTLVDFYDVAREKSQETIQKINRIRISIMEDFKGFKMYYQPIVDAKSEKLIAAEALLRWSDDEFGFVPPDVFMPVVENDARFYQLGLWILKRSITDFLPIVKNDKDFLLHVNIAYTQLQKGTFVRDVIKLLEEVGYPAQSLCLELTERCRLIEKNRLKNIIAQLKSYGVRFALDDFGTGYSSANLIRDLDLDIVKIDRSFIGDIEFSDKEREALRCLVEYADIYNSETCVEGIENLNMREKVLDCSAKALQGFYYSRPVPYDEFKKWADRDNDIR